MTLPANAPEAVEVLRPGLSRVRSLVPMRDGVELATDIYWSGATPLDQLPATPVLLERSPYNVRSMRMSDGRHADGTPVSPESGAAHFVDAGYVVVRQDCRGRGGSAGTFSKYTGEAQDGFDTHAWLAAQPWCSGEVVTAGVSYSAHTQTAAASVGARPISAMILDSGGFSDAWTAGGRFGGAYELKQVTWALKRVRQRHPVGTPLGDALDAMDLQAWFAALPWSRGHSPLSAVPDYEDFVFEQWEHEARDEFWTRPGLYARGFYDRFPAVPILSISSWYDPYVLTAVDNFAAGRAKDPRSALMLGPWTHGARSVTWAGDVDFGLNATLDGNLAPDYLVYKERWLDALRTGASWPSVTYFVMGGGSGRRIGDRLDHGGRWQTATTWPPASVVPQRFWLDEGGLLAESAPGGEPSSVTYEHDPRNPVPSRGGGITSGEPLMSGGAFDQVAPASAGGAPLPLSARRDVVTFHTEPLTAPVTIAGPVLLEVDFSSDCVDTDLVATLVDVHPPNGDYPLGYAMNVTDGMLRLRFRNDPAQAELMTPGERYRVTLRLPDTANLFDVGHRIRIDIASSNFPRCDVNPNTGGPVASDRTARVARNTIHLGDSALLLPVLPSEHGNTDDPDTDHRGTEH